MLAAGGSGRALFAHAFGRSPYFFGGSRDHQRLNAKGTRFDFHKRFNRVYNFTSLSIRAPARAS